MRHPEASPGKCLERACIKEMCFGREHAVAMCVLHFWQRWQSSEEGCSGMEDFAAYKLFFLASVFLQNLRADLEAPSQQGCATH